jgi:hypothetical protein
MSCLKGHHYANYMGHHIEQDDVDNILQAEEQAKAACMSCFTGHHYVNHLGRHIEQDDFDHVLQADAAVGVSRGAEAFEPVTSYDVSLKIEEDDVDSVLQASRQQAGQQAWHMLFHMKQQLGAR